MPSRGVVWSSAPARLLDWLNLTECWTHQWSESETIDNGECRVQYYLTRLQDGGHIIELTVRNAWVKSCPVFNTGSISIYESAWCSIGNTWKKTERNRVEENRQTGSNYNKKHIVVFRCKKFSVACPNKHNPVAILPWTLWASPNIFCNLLQMVSRHSWNSSSQSCLSRLQVS
jgi:hypothetical protein